jgi:hypothetical protein
MKSVKTNLPWYIVTAHSVIRPEMDSCPVQATISVGGPWKGEDDVPEDLMVVQAESEAVARFIHMVYVDFNKEGMIFCEGCQTFHIGPYIQQIVPMDDILRELDDPNAISNKQQGVFN